MNWQSKSYYSRNRFYFSETDIDFTSDRIDYSQFFLQEFFNADKETTEQITSYYINQYGKRSLSYLQRKYVEWKNGNYHLTDLMKDRIIDLMPLFLNEKAKHSLGIHVFMSSIKQIVSSHIDRQKNLFKSVRNLKNLQELIEIFRHESDRINNISYGFFKFNVLSDDEKNEAMEIARHILNSKLQISFDQLERDFNVFLPLMGRFKRGRINASYNVIAHNLKIDITTTSLQDLSFPKFKINEPFANSKFKIFSDKYLAYELATLYTEKNKATVNSYLNEDDLTLFFAQYEQLSSGGSEVSLKSRFNGEGGDLVIEILLRPIKMLWHFLLTSVTKLIIYVALVVGLIALAISFTKFWPLIIYGGLFVFIYFYTVIKEELLNIKNLSIEMKRYGK